MAKEYLLYFLYRTDHHSLQNPFAFDTYRNLIAYHRMHRNGNPFLENIRSKLSHNSRMLTVNDQGAGSSYTKNRRRSIASICKVACSSKSYNLLYQFLLSQSPGNVVVELGTCLGINTGYLAAKAKGTVYTFEADPTLLEIAKDNLSMYKNVRFVFGNIRNTLPQFLNEHSHIDYIQVDAHHTYDATLCYCKMIWPYLHENSVVIIGDIHWSVEMKTAWNEIKKFPGVCSSMDFFECGVLFFKYGIQEEHHVLFYPRS
jgi:predicted O-methyltransferase YrrM